jgi:hypothetical protein
VCPYNEPVGRGARYGKLVYALAAIPPIVAILTAQLAPDPHGHWSDHLSSAGLKSAQLVLLLVLVTMLGWRTLSALLLISFAVVESGIALQVIGDYQVADSIWRTSGNPGFGDGYTEGHDRSELGDLLVSVGGLAFAITAGIAQRVPGTLAVVAGVMVIIPPPWVWPAAGVLVLILYGLTSESRLLPRTRPGRTEPADASRSVNPGV